MKDHLIKLANERPELDLKHIARAIVRKGLRRSRINFRVAPRTETR